MEGLAAAVLAVMAATAKTAVMAATAAPLEGEVAAVVPLQALRALQVTVHAEKSAFIHCRRKRWRAML